MTTVAAATDKQLLSGSRVTGFPVDGIEPPFKSRQVDLAVTLNRLVLFRVGCGNKTGPRINHLLLGFIPLLARGETKIPAGVTLEHADNRFPQPPGCLIMVQATQVVDQSHQFPDPV